MEFVLDTVTLVRYFSKKGKIGKTAKNLIKKTEENNGKLFISIISLMEIMYLAEKNRISISLEETIKSIKQNKTKQNILNYKF